ncbi:hypothetical protein L596_018034 [Steinernema carpocapsae]|uniref:RanBD1 domain-containing protein n=1 Tax=Steinernema carpocapsae TaxID=34508 RepID=A0A4U5N3V0_STECR|nr:hypothetical protein L596_018034 [Steinernema carpocapsae]
MPHEETLERRLARSMEPHSDVTDGCFSTAETASLSRSKSRTSSLRDIFGLGRTKKVDEKAKLAQSMEQLTSTQDGLRTQITELQESVAKLGIDEDAKAWRHWVQSTLEGAVAAQKAQEERFDDIQKILEQQAEMLKNQGEQFLAALTPIQQTVEKLLMKSEKKVRFQEGTKGGDDFDEPSTPIPPPRTLFSSCSSQENPRTALFMVGTSSESFQDSEARDSGDKPIFGSGKPIFGFDSVTGEDIFSGTPSKPTPNPKDFQFGVPRGSSGSIESGDDESQAHFDPLVSLPPVVDLKTGEEDEEVLFCERARIYRYIPP